MVLNNKAFINKNASGEAAGICICPNCFNLIYYITYKNVICKLAVGVIAINEMTFAQCHPVMASLAQSSVAQSVEPTTQWSPVIIPWRIWTMALAKSSWNHYLKDNSIRWFIGISKKETWMYFRACLNIFWHEAWFHLVGFWNTFLKYMY